jgi:isopentenyl-diphosphate delta-isomerase
MPEELGIEGKLDYLHKFEYHVPYKDVGSENEICGTLIGIIDKSTELKEIEGEIDEIKWISSNELLSEVKANPEIYCPWMLIALELLNKSDKSMLEKHANVLSTWMTSDVHEGLQNAIKTHLPQEKWRLVNEKN